MNRNHKVKSNTKKNTKKNIMKYNKINKKNTTKTNQNDKQTLVTKKNIIKKHYSHISFCGEKNAINKIYFIGINIKTKNSFIC